MLPQWVIEKKRDGHALSEQEIRDFINGFTAGSIPDYQMSALAMAIVCRGMSFDETAMMRSGACIDLSSITKPKIDKHSSGGIGDKVSLVLAPLAASLGLAVPMLSGRGLGLTGGTLDKLEAIPGYRCNLSEAELLDVVRRCGCAITGQTSDLAPADRKFYALRDVTGTVASVPLIAASIMSKKLAESVDGLVLDVKVGSGAFFATIELSRELAQTMVEVGKRMGRRMEAVVTDMNEPLGYAAGNGVEVAECIDIMRGNAEPRLKELCLDLTARMLVLGEVDRDYSQAKARAEKNLASGAALEKFREMVILQGGDPKVVDDPSRLPQAKFKVSIVAKQSGFVSAVNADGIGRAVMLLGAGRTKVGDLVDPAVGVTALKKVGEKISIGDPLCLLLSNVEAKTQEALSYARQAFSISKSPPPPVALIHEVIPG